MPSPDKTPGFELIYVVVNYGMGSKVLHKAKEYGVSGGTILLGKGTVNHAFLNFLSIYDERKEVVIMGADKATASYVAEKLTKDFQFEKPYSGIIFNIGTCGIIGSRMYQDINMGVERGVNNSMYQLIITIVDKGKAEDVISAASQAGSKGGTIVNARGSGIHETSKLFNMEIEPEKEMVMILAKQDVTEPIVSSIRKQLELDKPGNGIIFIQDVNRAHGIIG
jgi:nitrogen regulatory protein PII